MMMKQYFRKALGLILCLLTINIFTVSAQEVTAGSLWKEANEAFTQNHFDIAKTKYELILKQGVQSADVYYNLGNTYFRLNEFPLAMLNYQRALKLAPGAKLTKQNIELTQSKIPNATVSQSNGMVFKIWDNLCYALNPNSWAVLIVISCIAIAVFIYLRKAKPQGKLGKTYGIWIALVLVVITFATSALINEIDFSPKAVVMVTQAQVFPEPNVASQFMGNVYAGTLVDIKEQKDGFIRIVLSNGVSGWVSLTAIEKV